MPFDVYGRIGEADIDDVPHVLVRARGDGNCLFHAAGHQLLRNEMLHDDVDDAATLRNEIVDRVELSASALTALGFRLRDQMGIHLNQATQDNATPLTAEQNAQIAQRLLYLRGDGHWGDEACITAIELAYDVVVQVFDDQGSPTNAFDLDHYQSVHADPGGRTVLKLCVRYAGYRPYHYDFFVNDYDEETDNVAEEMAPPLQGGSSPATPYYLGPRISPLVLVPIDHAAFAYPKPAKAKSSEEVSVPLGEVVSVVDKRPPPAPLSVRLRNATEDGKSSFSSTSFNPEGAGGSSKPAGPYEERFVLRLLEPDKHGPIEVPDLEHTTLQIETDRPVEGDNFHVRVYTMTAKAEKLEGLVMTLQVPVKKAVAEHTKDKPSRYTIPAREVLTVKEAHFLSSAGSPYQLCVSTVEDFPPAATAWTFFHMPSPAEIGSLICARCVALDHSVQAALEWIAGRASLRVAIYNDGGVGHCSSALSTLTSMLYLLRKRVEPSSIKLATINIYGGTAKGLEQARAMLTGLPDLVGFKVAFEGSSRPWFESDFSIGAGCRNLAYAADAPSKWLKTTHHLQLCPVGHIMEEEYTQFRPGGEERIFILRADRGGEEKAAAATGRKFMQWRPCGRCPLHDTVELIYKPFHLPPPVEPKLTLEQCPMRDVILEVMHTCNTGKIVVMPAYGMGKDVGSIINSPLNLANMVRAAFALTGEKGGPEKVVVLDLSRDASDEIHTQTRTRLAEALADDLAAVTLVRPTTAPHLTVEAIQRFVKFPIVRVMLVHAPGLKPRALFDNVFTTARLPPAFEGAGTKSTMQTFGRPFLFLSKTEKTYPAADGFSDELRTALQTAANQILGDAPGKELIQFLHDSYTGANREYFEAISGLSERSTKLWEALAAFEQTRTGKFIAVEPTPTLKQKLLAAAKEKPKSEEKPKAEDKKSDEAS